MDIQHWRQAVSADNPDMHFWDILGRSPLRLQVTNIGMKQTNSEDKNTMLFLFFKDEKPLGLNVTNSYIMELYYGENPNGWVGKDVVLRTAKCKGSDCIRIQTPPNVKLPRNITKFKYTDNAGKVVSKPQKPAQQPAERPVTPSKAVIAQQDADLLYDMIEESGADMGGFLRHYAIEDITDLPAGKLKEASDLLQKKIDKQHAQTAQTTLENTNGAKTA